MSESQQQNSYNRMATSYLRHWNKALFVTVGMVLGYLLSLNVTKDYLCITPQHNKEYPSGYGQYEPIKYHNVEYNGFKRSERKESISSDDNMPRTYRNGVGLGRQPRTRNTNESPRKILLDCGANVASTVQLFRETYPDGKNYFIHSFELDKRLAPYFSSYSNHELHCPVAVAGNNGLTTAYTESSWKPDKGNVSGKDMQWGGGAIYPKDSEKQSEMHGRRFSERNVIPKIDISTWIQQNTDIDDYVILKLDVEGAEYEIIDKMLKEGTFKWVDKLYGEFHPWAPVPGWSYERKLELRETMKHHGVTLVDWRGEGKAYHDIESLNKPEIPQGTPGFPGNVYNNCSWSPDGQVRLAVTVKVGMNVKAAFKLVETIRAHHSGMPITLFVYGDFAQVFPDLVTKWADRYTIGIRENQPFPTGHWTLLGTPVMRMSLVASVQRLKELALNPVYYLSADLSKRVQGLARHRGLRIIQPTTSFPPNQGTLLLEDTYYKYNDVQRTPKALRVLYERISNGGILSLDSDHIDSYMISIFLMDYLFENPRWVCTDWRLGNITTLIMTDFSKAFDRIDHTVAISKLIKLGARPSIIPWISDFVSNRRQRVRYGGQLSEWEILTCSVPQGTLLGPILFLAVFDDAVRDAAPSIHEWKYVDDLTMTESRHRLERSIMQEELDKFGQWSKDNYMLLNGDKCKIMTICFLRIPPAPPSLNIYGSELESVAVACLLGVWLQANLKWETNVTKMLNKANGRLFLLRRLKHFNLPVNDLLQVYKSYVRPVVEYCAPVWHPGLTSSQSARLERIQKRALRTILRGQYVDYNSALHTTGLQSLSSRRTDLCRKFASKINPDLLPPRGSEEHGRNTRNANKLRTVKCRTNRYQNSTIPYLIRLLNE
ncbi:uncharacterized protein LOC144916733 [Branchiostoma floridae x Branchiostoma belcheri]